MTSSHWGDFRDMVRESPLLISLGSDSHGLRLGTRARDKTVSGLSERKQAEDTFSH